MLAPYHDGFPDVWCQVIDKGRILAVGDEWRLDVVRAFLLDTSNDVTYGEIQEFIGLNSMQRVFCDITREHHLGGMSIHETYINPLFRGRPAMSMPRMRQFRPPRSGAHSSSSLST